MYIHLISSRTITLITYKVLKYNNAIYKNAHIYIYIHTYIYIGIIGELPAIIWFSTIPNSTAIAMSV